MYCASIHGLGFEDCDGNQDIISEIYEPIENTRTHTFNIFTHFQRSLVYKFPWYDNPHTFMLYFYDNNEKTPIDIQNFILASSINNIKSYQISEIRLKNRLLITFNEDEYSDFILIFIEKPKVFVTEYSSRVISINEEMRFPENPIKYFIRIKKIYKKDIPYIRYAMKERQLEMAA